jgi:hypothetical protein
MLPEPIVQLLREIYAEEDNEEILQVLRDNPEEILICLLAEIKQDLHIVSATLADTVESAASNVIPSIKEMNAEYAAKKEHAKK